MNRSIKCNEFRQKLLNPGDFDPYYTWLGIPPKHQPANPYRLLGIENGESDPDVIDYAWDQRSRHVKMFRVGQHAAAAEKILNELAEARILLLKTARTTQSDVDTQVKTQEKTNTTNAALDQPQQVNGQLNWRQFSSYTFRYASWCY